MSQLEMLTLHTTDEWTNDDWATPMVLVRELESEFGPFDLDPCTHAEAAKAPKFYTKEDDGLTKPWVGRVFCNPPYSRKVEFLQKAYESSQAGCTCGVPHPRERTRRVVPPLG